MVARKPSVPSIDSVHSIKSPASSSSNSNSINDCDADDEATMSAEESQSQSQSQSQPQLKPQSQSQSQSTLSRPMSGGVPLCPRRPNLREILANTAPSPWTLAAFMAYLSNNHCLETLEFTMDAGRYKKHYHRMMNKAAASGEPSAKDAAYVGELWNRLMEAYIQPNGSREVNLPSQVRDPILQHQPSNLPPEPAVLEPAVSKTYELMEESVLVPFLNSVYPQPPTPVSPYYSNHSNESMSPAPVEEKSRFSRRSRHTTSSSRGSPPPLSSTDFSSSYSPPLTIKDNRKSAPSALTTALSRHRFSVKLSPTSSGPGQSLNSAVSTTSSVSDAIYSGPSLTDDSGSSGSPTNECPMTPPVTPPMSDISGSPRAHRESGTWKKLGRLGGWRKKGSQQGFDLQTL